MSIHHHLSDATLGAFTAGALIESISLDFLKAGGLPDVRASALAISWLCCGP